MDQLFVERAGYEKGWAVTVPTVLIPNPLIVVEVLALVVHNYSGDPYALEKFIKNGAKVYKGLLAWKRVKHGR